MVNLRHTEIETLFTADILTFQSRKRSEPKVLDLKVKEKGIKVMSPFNGFTLIVCFPYVALFSTLSRQVLERKALCRVEHSLTWAPLLFVDAEMFAVSGFIYFSF